MTGSLECLTIGTIMAKFTPPQFVPPTPRTPSSSGSEIPNISNIPGSVEQAGEVAKSVAKSHTIKTTTSFIISSRKDFADYLHQNGLELVTSWVDFEATKDFIQSSYILYPQNGNAIERVADFIARYPQLKEAVELVNQRMKNN